VVLGQIGVFDAQEVEFGGTRRRDGIVLIALKETPPLCEPCRRDRQGRAR
jgi:hypothetical protein